MDCFNLALLTTPVALLTAAACILILAIAAIVRPWDSDVTRAYRLCQSTPFPLFWLVAWVYAVAERIAAMKPAPMRIAELANGYVASQVLFSLVSLRVPEALLSGPKTAAEVAKHIGPSTNVQWLDRLLSAAAVLGLLNRTKTTRAASAEPVGASPAQEEMAAVQPMCELVYGLNAVSAALTPKSPVNMAHFVRMCQDKYVAFDRLAEGIHTSTVPYELHTGGQKMWDFTFSDPQRAATFDLAMVAVNHIGGSAAVNTYPWRQFDCVIDVAGGVGGFLADILCSSSSPQAIRQQGILFDLQKNIDRARKLWSSSHPELLPQVQMVAGDMFDAATIPAPPDTSSCTAYVLRNIMHDWSDAECVAILKAIRSSVSRAQHSAAAGFEQRQRVRLLIVEVTTTEEILPCHLPYRHTSDLVMLASFGSAQERNKQQFEALLAASGWKLLRVRPTSGIFMVVEAEPV